MINVYLDDVRECPKGFTIARSYDEVMMYLRTREVNILSLDHDLGENENNEELKTGYDVVKSFCEEGLYVEKIYIHTDNVVGRENMYQTLLAAQKRGFIAKEIKIKHYPLV